MRASDIITHMWQWLPQFTDSFSDSLTPESVAVSGNTVTVTKTAHGLPEDGCIISVTGAEEEILVDNIDDSGDSVEMTLVAEHDLTTGTPADC